MDNEIHYIYKVWESFIHGLCNFKTKQPIVTGPNPQEPPLEALQNSTKHDSILCRVYSRCILNVTLTERVVQVSLINR